MYTTQEFRPNDDSKVSSQQLALLLEDQLSKNATTPGIDLSIQSNNAVSPLQQE